MALRRVQPASRRRGRAAVHGLQRHVNIDDEFGLYQFEFTQAVWANNPGFPQVPAGTAAPGLDPVIGQGPRPQQTYPTQWGGTQTQQVDVIVQAVRMRGGEYFFMPSLAFLRSL